MNEYKLLPPQLKTVPDPDLHKYKRKPYIPQSAKEVYDDGKARRRDAPCPGPNAGAERVTRSTCQMPLRAYGTSPPVHDFQSYVAEDSADAH